MKLPYFMLPYGMVHFTTLLTGVGISERKSNKRKSESFMVFWVPGTMLAA